MHIKKIQCLRIGRYDDQEKDCCLWWSGSGIRFRVACRYLTLDAEAEANDHAPWLGVLADGAPVARFPLLPGRRTYPILSGMDPAFPHEITILRDTQPTPDEKAPVILHALDTDGTPEMPAPRKRLIEFIGDSLTVGEGCTGPQSAAEWRMAWMCHMGAFPTLTAEALNADKRVIGVSGWGVWKSWDCLPEHRLGLVYEKLCALIPAGDVPYAFRERQADAVVINLGTNDGNALSQEENRQEAERQLIARAEELMRMVRAHQPNAAILWAYGLCGNPIEALLRKAVENLWNTGEKNVFYVPLPECGADIGSRQHPSRAAHRRAAEAIANALKEIWKDEK